MASNITFFEDDALKNFHPLTLTRPVYDLRVGILTLAEKWLLDMKSDQLANGPMRKTLKGLFQEPAPLQKNSSCYWINSRVFPDQNLVKAINGLQIGESLVKDNLLIAAHMGENDHNLWITKGASTGDVLEVSYTKKLRRLDDIWQIFQFNGLEIKNDIGRIKDLNIADNGRHQEAILVGEHDIIIQEGAVIEPGAILFAEEGPIFIGKNARVMANSVVRGPAAVCESSIVKMGAKIYKDTTIGPVCKVGGEVSNVVFHSYSNKGHDGYAGNSVFGQWCNIGADTNTSNLKNNYSTVRFRTWGTGEEVDTGQQFIGTIMGDHSKTGINTMLNTGTLCGVCCNLFADGYPPKYIPSFSWVSGKDVVPYHFEKALEAMDRMMERRDVKLTPAYKKMMQSIFKSTL